MQDTEWTPENGLPPHEGCPAGYLTLSSVGPLPTTSLKTLTCSRDGMHLLWTGTPLCQTENTRGTYTILRSPDVSCPWLSCAACFAAQFPLFSPPVQHGGSTNPKVAWLWPSVPGEEGRVLGVHGQPSDAAAATTTTAEVVHGESSCAAAFFAAAPPENSRTGGDRIDENTNDSTGSSTSKSSGGIVENRSPRNGLWPAPSRATEAQSLPRPERLLPERRRRYRRKPSQRQRRRRRRR